MIERATGANPAAVIEAARALTRAPRAVILVGQHALRAADGFNLAMNVQDLLLLTGKQGRPGCGVGPLAEENNDQGAIEMGAVAEYLPGPCEWTDRAARERFTALWKDELPQVEGRTLSEILDEARAGSVRAMFVVGENPVGSLPPSARAEEALANLDLLVCHELFLTETAALAHVVLPACSYAEKNGTFTNTEGLVQSVRQAIEAVGESRPDWEIFSALSVLMGYPLEYTDAKEIFKEIRSAIAGYALMGATPAPPRPDPAAVDRYVCEGYAEDLAIRYRWPAGEETHGEGLEKTFTLMLTQTLFHSGKLSTKAKGLLQVQAAGFLAMNPADASGLGIAEGDRVRVFNDCGEMATPVKLLDRVPIGVALFPDHFDRDARRLLRVSIDPVTKVPYFRTATVRIAKLER
jgi:formate dehydrogenase alpha subunit